MAPDLHRWMVGGTLALSRSGHLAAPEKMECDQETKYDKDGPAVEHRRVDANARRYARGVNVGNGERVLSVIGAGLAAVGASRRSLGGLVLTPAGGLLAYRGLSGHCQIYQAFGIDSDAGPRRGNLGIKVDRSIQVNAPPARRYAFWRRFENLPRIMSNIESVRVISDTRSHWTGPGAGWLHGGVGRRHHQ